MDCDAQLTSTWLFTSTIFQRAILTREVASSHSSSFWYAIRVH